MTVPSNDSGPENSEHRGPLAVLLEPQRVSLLLLIAIFFAGFLAAYGLMKTASSDRRSLINKLTEERDNAAELDRQNEILSMRLDESEKSLTLLREDLSASRQELLALERDNTFYKGLVSPEDLQRGFKLHRFEIERISADKPAEQKAATGLRDGEVLYRYEAIVAHVGGRGKKLSGNLNLSLLPKRPAFLEVVPLDNNGKAVDEEEQLFVLKDEISHKLGFRFFQRINGEIKLPANFEPATISLTGQSNLSKKLSAAGFDVTYDWRELLAQAE